MRLGHCFTPKYPGEDNSPGGKSGRAGSGVADAVSIELKYSDAIATGGGF